MILEKFLILCFSKPLTQWYDSEITHCLPYAYNDLTKPCTEIIRLQNVQIDMIDAYSDFYRPDHISELSDMYTYKISNSIRDFMPNFTINYSPFVVRVGPGRRREQTKGNAEMKNPSLMGQSSPGSTDSSDR